MFNRQLSRPWETLTQWIAGIIPILGVLMILNFGPQLGFVIHRPQYLALFLMLTMLLVYIKAPARTKDRARIPWYDYTLMLMVVAGCSFIIVMYPTVRYELGSITPVRVFFAVMTLIALLEAVRRITGWILVILSLIFMVYALISESVPGILYSRNVSWERLVTFLYLDIEGVMGVALDTIGIIVLGFVLLGNLLFMFGAGEWLTQLALKAFGKVRGGPAQISIVTSALFGSVSGSAAANVAFTGKLTIPLMKRVGYKPEYAAAVESSASTAGLITPPILGTTGFLMAEFLNIPYADVVIATIIPAILYYFVMMVQVNQESVKHGLRGLTNDEINQLIKEKVSHGVIFLIPLFILFLCLFHLHLPVASSAVYSIFSALLASVFHPESRRRVKSLSSALVETGYNLVQPGIISGVAGIILGVVTLKGLGSMLSQMLIGLTNENLLIMLIATAVICIVLGMGMPAVAIYVLLAVLVAPALTEMGVHPMAAHLFIVYFGIMSYVTPPMAFACFVAAPMAEANVVRTGFTAMKLSLAAYIVPFYFIYYPSLLMEGPLLVILLSFLKVLLVCLLLVFCISGFWIRKLHLAWRLVFLAGALMLFSPSLTLDVIAAMIPCLYLVSTRLMKRYDNAREKSLNH